MILLRSMCSLIIRLAVQPRQDIEITLPDGSKRQGKSWETSPMSIAREISKGLADRIVIAKVSFFRWRAPHLCLQVARRIA